MGISQHRSRKRCLATLTTVTLLATYTLALTKSPIFPSTGHCAWTRYGAPFSRTLLPTTCPLPLTEGKTTSDPRTFSPWSQRPYCLEPRPPKVDDDVDISGFWEEPKSHKPTYCVFTADTFRGARGLSILTTPELAANWAGYLDDSLVGAELKAALEDSSWRDFSNASSPARRLVREAQIPGRGTGLVATRRIEKGEVVLADFPSLVALNDIAGTAASPAQIELLLRRAAERLPGETAGAITGRGEQALARMHGGHVVRDVLRTNAFSVDIEGEGHLGLFLRHSRMNHDCMPNTFNRYSRTSMAQDFVALRDIEAGEEVTHSYADLGLPSRERRQALSLWRFTCDCSLCSSSAGALAASDGRRARIPDIAREILGTGLTSVQIGERVDELLYLVDREGMGPLLGRYYLIVARAYLLVGMAEKAREYIKLAEGAWDENYRQVELSLGLKKLWKQLEAAEKATGTKKR